MDTNALVALIGSVVLGLVIRLSNVVVQWLSRVLGVDPPDPIPTPSDAAEQQRQHGTGSTPAP